MRSIQTLWTHFLDLFLEPTQHNSHINVHLKWQDLCLSVKTILRHCQVEEKHFLRILFSHWSTETLLENKNAWFTIWQTTASANNGLIAPQITRGPQGLGQGSPGLTLRQICTLYGVRDICRYVVRVPTLWSVEEVEPGVLGEIGRNCWKEIGKWFL